MVQSPLISLNWKISIRFFEDRKSVSVFLEAIVDGNHTLIWEDKEALLETPVSIKNKSAPKLEEKEAEKTTITVKSIDEKETEIEEKTVEPVLEEKKPANRKTKIEMFLREKDE